MWINGSLQPVHVASLAGDDHCIQFETTRRDRGRRSPPWTASGGSPAQR
jgi:hypothetical protein